MDLAGAIAPYGRPFVRVEAYTELGASDLAGLCWVGLNKLANACADLRSNPMVVVRAPNNGTIRFNLARRVETKLHPINREPSPAIAPGTGVIYPTPNKLSVKEHELLVVGFSPSTGQIVDRSVLPPGTGRELVFVQNVADVMSSALDKLDASDRKKLADAMVHYRARTVDLGLDRKAILSIQPSSAGEKRLAKELALFCKMLDRLPHDPLQETDTLGGGYMSFSLPFGAESWDARFVKVRPDDERTHEAFRQVDDALAKVRLPRVAELDPVDALAVLQEFREVLNDGFNRKWATDYLEDVLSRLPSHRFDTLGKKARLVSALGKELTRLGLAVECPTCGKPSALVCTRSQADGAFQFNHLDKGGRHSKDAANPDRPNHVVPRLKLVLRPAGHRSKQRK
ncbi:hypothetical protein RAS2_09890 [Phycisphaerae bacterium RAS2]|nr:hypothetical protein RAS2_09890 [Phycisphaerae bacterium RAS2]